MLEEVNQNLDQHTIDYFYSLILVACINIYITYILFPFFFSPHLLSIIWISRQRSGGTRSRSIRTLIISRNTFRRSFSIIKRTSRTPLRWHTACTLHFSEFVCMHTRDTLVCFLSFFFLVHTCMNLLLLLSLLLIYIFVFILFLELIGVITGGLSTYICDGSADINRIYRAALL